MLPVLKKLNDNITKSKRAPIYKDTITENEHETDTEFGSIV